MSNEVNRVGFFTQALTQLDNTEKVSSDVQFNYDTPRARHDESYTAILDAYTESVRDNLKKKSTYKSITFWISCAFLVIIFLLMVFILIYLVCKKSFTGVAQWCAIVVPALASFLTVFIVIPKVITKYLFNSEEEKYMSEIIKNLQDYDKIN